MSEDIGRVDDACSACLGWEHLDAHDNAIMADYIYSDSAAEIDYSKMHKRCIGSGESRTAWLINGVVYKVGRQTANRYEHEVLTEWRAAGAHWAPATTLWEVEVTRFGYTETEVVIAMPYLPDDGGAPNEVDLAMIKAAAPQTCAENWTTHGGRTYLIDGCDVEASPPSNRLRA